MKALKTYIKRNPKKSIVLAIIIALILIYILFGMTKKEYYYVTAPVIKNKIEAQVLVTGNILPENQISISPQTSGEIKKVYVKVGEKVKKDDLIAEIDPKTQENDLKIATANVEKIKAAILSRKAQYNNAQKEYNRQKILFKYGATSRALYDEAIMRFEIAKAELTQFESDLITYEKQLETAKINLEHTKIKAPSDGTILALLVEEGQFVNVSFNAVPMAIIANLEKLIIKSEVGEVDINKIKEGQPVSFYVIGNDKKKYYTKIKLVEPGNTGISNANAGNAIYYFIKMDAPNPDKELQVGMTVNATIIEKSIENALIIPKSALNIEKDMNNEVLVFNKKNNQYEKRKVTLGISDGVNMQVLNGLEEHEFIVVQKVKKSKKDTA